LSFVHQPTEEVGGLDDEVKTFCQSSSMTTSC
jgi:hypothetical protein